MALWSMAGLVAPLLARARSTLGRMVEKAAVRELRVLVSVVPACPTEKAMNSTLSHCLLRAALKEEYFSYFLDLNVAAGVHA